MKKSKPSTQKIEIRPKAPMKVVPPKSNPLMSKDLNRVKPMDKAPLPVRK